MQPNLWSNKSSLWDIRFLLAQLHMNTLIGLPTRGDVKNALRSLAKGIDGLDETYNLAMERIERQGDGYRELAKKILAWIIQAQRPLSTLELRHALAVRSSMTKPDHDFIPALRILQSVCIGLVTVDEKSEVIRLVHYTTQEYFERTWPNWFPNAQTDITIVCITYLSFNIFNSGVCQTDDEFRRRCQEYPLFVYAAQFWAHHARQLSTLPLEVVDFLECETKVQASGQVMLLQRQFRWGINVSEKFPNQISGIHLAAYFGLEQAIKPLLSTPTLKFDGYGRTPLWYAAETENRAVVEVLLANNHADVKNSDGWTPLSWAARNGHKVVAQLLLAKDGIDVNSQDSLGMTPLLYAAERGHETIVQLLFAKGGVDLNTKSMEGRTSLLYAAKIGHEAVVQLLLAQHDIDVNAEDQYGGTPLTYAVQNGHKAVCQLLLIHGGVYATPTFNQYSAAFVGN